MISKPSEAAAATLDYRSPATAGSPRLRRVMRELAQADTLGGATVGMKVALGVPLSLIGPAVIASILFTVDRRLQAGVLPGFGGTLLLTTILMFPLLMWLERRSRGEFFIDSVRGETGVMQTSGYGEFELQRTKFGWIAWTEIALTGPRLLWEAVDGLRGRVSGDAHLRLLAAEVVVELLDAGEGVPVRQLVRPERPAPLVGRAIDYLVQREWAGVASRRDRVWLATPIRERLARV